jgi:hypothetical protein
MISKILSTKQSANLNIFILCPQFVQNKYVPHTNNFRLPKVPKAPPGGRAPQVVNIWCTVKKHVFSHIWKEGKNTLGRTRVNHGARLVLSAHFKEYRNTSLWLPYHVVQCSYKIL